MLSFLAADTNNSTSTCNDFRIPARVMGLLQSNPCQHLQHRHLRCSQKGQQLIYPCCKKQSWQHKFLMMPLLLQSTVKRLPTYLPRSSSWWQKIQRDMLLWKCRKS